MKVMVLGLLILAGVVGIPSKAMQNDLPVSGGQPVFYWHNNEWETFRDGNWIPANQFVNRRRNFAFGNTDRANRQTAGIGRPNGQPGHTTIGIGQRTIGIGQPTIGIGQRTIGIGQPTIGIGQPTIGIGQPTIGIGQPNGGIGQTTIGIGRPQGTLGQPNSIGRPTIGIGQPTFGKEERSPGSNQRREEKPGRDSGNAAQP